MAFAAARMIEQRNREKARKTSNDQLVPPRGGRGPPGVRQEERQSTTPGIDRERNRRREAFTKHAIFYTYKVFSQ